MRSNMIEFMDVFVHVVELNSFTRAAEHLQIHRPAVSKAIRQLEHELGVKLLHRTTRKLNLTDEGKEFYLRSKRLLNDVSDLMASYSPTQHPRGRLRLDTPLTLAHNILIPALSEFQALYPDIEVVLTSSDRKTDLISAGIDCVIRLGELDDSSLVSRRLGEVQLIVCAAPAYIQKYGLPRTLDELEPHQAVNFFNEHSREVMDWKFLVGGEIVSRRLTSSILVDNSDTMLSAGLAGLGLIQGLKVALSPFLQRGELTEILPEYPCAPKTVSVLFPDRRHLAPKVRVFIDWFSQVFARYDG